MNGHPQSQRRQATLAAGRKRKPFDLPGFLIRRLPIVIIVGGLLAGVLALLLVPWARPVFETEGILLVDPAKEPTLTGRERDVIPGDLGDYTRTLASRVTRYDILADAMRRMDPTNRPAFLDPRDPEPRNVYRLMRHMRVQEVPRTHLLRTTLSADEPAGLAHALEAVMDSFVEHLRLEQEQKNAMRLDYLRDERDQIVRRIDEQRQRLLGLADTVPNKAFLHESYTVHLSKLEQVQRLYWEAAAHASELQGQLRQAQHNQAALSQLDLQPYADERVADNFGINRIEQWTYEQLQSMRTGIDGLTASNADRQYVEARMQAMNDYLVHYKSLVNTQTIANLQQKRAFELESEVIKASNAWAGAQSAADDMATRLAAAQEEASHTSEAIFQASDVSFSVTSLRDRLAALNSRIDDCELEAKAPLRISIDRHAESPGRPARTNRSTLLLMALVLAFGGVAGACLLFDLLDNRLRSGRDVEAALGGPGPDPVASFVTEVAPASTVARLMLDAPEHPAARALRDLGLRLDHERERYGARVFLFAGVEPGAGCTTLALQAAHLLTYSCERVLLIEVNRARPGLARALRSPALTPTLEQALRQPSAVAPARDESRRLAVLPASGDGGAMINQARLLELLRDARESYDAVVLDVAPLQDDAMAHVCALHSDAVVLIARQDHSLYRDLRRAVELLIQDGVPALTAVLNQSSPRVPGAGTRWCQSRLRYCSTLHVQAVILGKALLARAREFWRSRS